MQNTQFEYQEGYRLLVLKLTANKRTCWLIMNLIFFILYSATPCPVFEFLQVVQPATSACVYSRFEKGCPTKAYATVPERYTGNGYLPV